MLGEAQMRHQLVEMKRAQLESVTHKITGSEREEKEEQRGRGGEGSGRKEKEEQRGRGGEWEEGERGTEGEGEGGRRREFNMYIYAH